MELHDLLKHLVDGLGQLGVKYLVTGSIASIFYGEPRFTNDIDVVADIKEDQVPGLLGLFPADEFSISEDVVRDAIRQKGQFNVIHPSSGLKIDVILPKGEAFDDSRFKRTRSICPMEGTRAELSSPEDVMIMKMRHYKQGRDSRSWPGSQSASASSALFPGKSISVL